MKDGGQITNIGFVFSGRLALALKMVQFLSIASHPSKRIPDTEFLLQDELADVQVPQVVGCRAPCRLSYPPHLLSLYLTGWKLSAWVIVYFENALLPEL